MYLYDGSHIQTLEQIRNGWTSSSRQVVDQCTPLTAEEFSAARGDRWSYAKNLDHLTRSAMAVAKGLKLPKLAIRLLIGKGFGESRSLMEVQKNYKQILADGAQVRGRFVPADATSKDSALEKWEDCRTLLLEGLEKWNEQQLDTHRMPHPLMGKLTVREMLFFTIFHTEHHLHSLKSD